MDTKQVSSYFSSLSELNQDSLLKDLNRIRVESDYSKLLQLRGDALDDKRYPLKKQWQSGFLLY